MQYDPQKLHRFHIDLPEGKKVFLASDFHLGAPNASESRLREHKIVEWLHSIEPLAHTLVLVGDVFDFWFEYTHVVPKGHTRLLGKLAQLADRGVRIVLFKGNHDLWMGTYLEEELGATILRHPAVFAVGQKLYFVAHGDGLGPQDHLHKLLLLVFENSFFQWVFRQFSPQFSFWIATKWSRKSRISNDRREEFFLGENEWLWQFARQVENTQHHEAYIFGHRHLPLDLPVGDHSRYINLGEWIRHCKYLILDKEGLSIHHWR